MLEGQTTDLQAVILAGGTGTRLWPLSKPSFPKQFLPLPDGKSMIQETLNRISPLVSSDQTWIVTNRNMSELVHRHLPEMPVSHILNEPVGRGTAPAIAWAATLIAKSNPRAVMASFHADHVITNTKALQESIRLGYELAQNGSLVTLGITPTSAETGYGYIHFTDHLQNGHSHSSYRVADFVEKPDKVTAESYLRDGHYVWNSGMFLWRVDVFLKEFRQYLPDIADVIDRIAMHDGNSDSQGILDELWTELPTITIDYGVLEKTRNLVVIPVDMGWNDVGNWEQYGSLFDHDAQGNHGTGHHLTIGSENTFVYNTTNRKIYTIGLSNMVIVETPDMTMICRKDQVQLVKKLAESQQTR